MLLPTRREFVNEKQTHLTDTMAAASLPSVTPLVQLALKELGAEPPTTQIVLRLAATLAAAVNRWPGVSGPQKAELVLTALREMLAMEEVRGKLKPEEVAVLRVMVDTVVPEILNLLVAAGRGEFDLRKPTPGCFAAVGAMLCRAGAAVAVAAAPGDASAQTAASVLQTVAQGASATVNAVAHSQATAVATNEKEDLTLNASADSGATTTPSATPEEVTLTPAQPSA